MIVLSTTSDIVRVTTSAAVALDVQASYADNTATSFAPGRQPTAISTATTTTVLSSPAASTQRGLKSLTAHARGGANAVSVELFDGSTAYRLASASLASGETLSYEDGRGWFVLAVDGATKGLIGATGPQGDTGPQGPQGPTASWSESLAVGATSGAHNPIIDTSQYLQFGLTPPETGQIRATGAFLCRSTGALTCQSDTTATITASSGALTLQATSGAASLTASGTTTITGGTGATITATTGTMLCQASAGPATLSASTTATLTGGTAVVTGGTGVTITATAGNAGLGAPAGGGFLTGNTVNVTGATGATITATTGNTAVAAPAGTVGITAAGIINSVAGNTFTASCTNAMGLTGGTGVTVTATTGNIALVNTAASGFVSVNSFLKFTAEANASTPSMSAGQALYWVKDNTPNDPYFTDDTNSDRKILTAPAPLADLATAADGTVVGRPLGGGTGALQNLSGAQAAAIAGPTHAGSGLSNVAGQLNVTAPYADVVATIPAVSAAALGFVDVSTALTPVAPLAVDDRIIVLPRGDGPPFSARVSAANTVRLGFQGAISSISSAPFRIYKHTKDLSSPQEYATAWHRVALATSDVNGISSLPDVLSAIHAVQAITARMPAVAASANGLPIMSFDGGDSLVVPISAATFSTNTLGVGFWVKVTSTATGIQQLISCTGGAGGASVNSFELRTSNDKLQVSYDDPLTSASVGRYGTTVSSVLVANTWAFVTWEYDSGAADDAAKCSVFVNGVKQTLTILPFGSGAPAEMTTLRSATGTMSIGCFVPGTQQLTGSIGPHIWWRTTKMSGATQGIWTNAARAALMAYDPPT
jgi:hypothetical protein